MVHAPNEIVLDVPATHDKLHLARRAASGFAERLATFGPDEIDDLQVAVGELCRQIVDACGCGSDLRLRLVARSAAVSVTIECDCPDLTAPESDGRVLSEQVFVALVDEYQVSHDSGVYRCSFLKRC